MPAGRPRNIDKQKLLLELGYNKALVELLTMDIERVRKLYEGVKAYHDALVEVEKEHERRRILRASSKRSNKARTKKEKENG